MFNQNCGNFKSLSINSTNSYKLYGKETIVANKKIYNAKYISAPLNVEGGAVIKRDLCLGGSIKLGNISTDLDKNIKKTQKNQLLDEKYNGIMYYDNDSNTFRIVQGGIDRELNSQPIGGGQFYWQNPEGDNIIPINRADNVTIFSNLDYISLDKYNQLAKLNISNDDGDHVAVFKDSQTVFRIKTDGDVIIHKNLNVDGESLFTKINSSIIDVDNLNVKDIDVSGPLNVKGISTFNGEANIIGHTEINNITIKGESNFKGNIVSTSLVNDFVKIDVNNLEVDVNLKSKLYSELSGTTFIRGELTTEKKTTINLNGKTNIENASINNLTSSKFKVNDNIILNNTGLNIKIGTIELGNIKLESSDNSITANKLTIDEDVELGKNGNNVILNIDSITKKVTIEGDVDATKNTITANKFISESNDNSMFGLKISDGGDITFGSQSKIKSEDILEIEGQINMNEKILVKDDENQVEISVGNTKETGLLIDGDLKITGTIHWEKGFDPPLPDGGGGGGDYPENATFKNVTIQDKLMFDEGAIFNLPDDFELKNTNVNGKLTFEAESSIEKKTVLDINTDVNIGPYIKDDEQGYVFNTNDRNINIKGDIDASNFKITCKEIYAETITISEQRYKNIIVSGIASINTIKTSPDYDMKFDSPNKYIFNIKNGNGNDIEFHNNSTIKSDNIETNNLILNDNLSTKNIIVDKDDKISFTDGKTEIENNKITSEELEINKIKVTSIQFGNIVIQNNIIVEKKTNEIYIYESIDKAVLDVYNLNVRGVSGFDGDVTFNGTVTFDNPPVFTIPDPLKVNEITGKDDKILSLNFVESYSPEPDLDKNLYITTEELNIYDLTCRNNIECDGALTLNSTNSSYIKNLNITTCTIDDLIINNSFTAALNLIKSKNISTKSLIYTNEYLSPDPSDKINITTEFKVLNIDIGDKLFPLPIISTNGFCSITGEELTEITDLLMRLGSLNDENPLKTGITFLNNKFTMGEDENEINKTTEILKNLYDETTESESSDFYNISASDNLSVSCEKDLTLFSWDENINLGTDVNKTKTISMYSNNIKLVSKYIKILTYNKTFKETQNFINFNTDERTIDIYNSEDNKVTLKYDLNSTLNISESLSVDKNIELGANGSGQFNIKNDTSNGQDNENYKTQSPFICEGDAYVVKNLHVDGTLYAKTEQIEGGVIDGNLTINGEYIKLPVKDGIPLQDKSWFINSNSSNIGSLWFVFGEDYPENATNKLNGYYFRTPTDLLEGNYIETSRGNKFTGQHPCYLKNNLENENRGLIVSTTNDIINYDNNMKPTINESLPVVEITIKEKDKRVFGVISYHEKDDISREIQSDMLGSRFEKELINERRTYINSVGEGSIWVSNKNGGIEGGDYIVSSAISGYGQKQDDDLLRNCTVAKISHDCNFDLTKVKKKEIKFTTNADGKKLHVFDENGLPTYNELDEEEYQYETRFLKEDGTLSNINDYDFIAMFVGCTYHCG